MANWRVLETLYGRAWLALMRQRIINTMIALFAIGFIVGFSLGALISR